MTASPSPIPIARPWFGPEEEAAVAAAVATGWVGQGPRVAAFEAALAERCGVRHAVALGSGTAALHLGLLALGVGPGQRVAVPSFTFVASASAVRMCGATPLLVDCRADTYNIDLEDLERRVEQAGGVHAVMVVHQFGLPAPMAGALALARRWGVPLVEDAACALGASWGGHPAGSAGALGCLSFHPRKVITTGEGGALLTDDAAVAARVCSLRSHGAEPGALSQGDLPDAVRLGYNYRLSDLQAALGLAQLARLDAMLQRRAALASRYASGLGSLDWLRLPWAPDGSVHAWQSYVVQLAGWELGAGRQAREALRSALAREGIATRPAATAVHTLSSYRDAAGGGEGALPGALAADRLAFALPLYPELEDHEQDRVIRTLLEHGSHLAATRQPRG